MPTPARYLEAMFLLDLRDLEGTRTSVHWQIEQNYIINDHESNVDFNELVEPFRQWAEIGWDEKADDPAGHRLKHEIYVEMKRKNQLPPAEEPGSDWGCRPLEERLRECNVSRD
ncbi:uncharacterized protein LDX57_002199 [Aspergillus melleus]|uniref:uncharacterized protein n=1 Tax=Aspergillus melleus TaxID=138277 RepID=UPI001E8CF012|nr:uncharacterized protein LDX57_002199 [Aspergillus melleus]KAH8424448.1 hypothetical protein LDX57_002199 [Aspergillus melleus]